MRWVSLSNARYIFIYVWVSSLLCDLRCDFKWSALANFFSQKLQKCFLSDLWIVSCFLTADFVGKLLEQNEHKNGRFPSLCFHILWAVKALDTLKDSLHSLHLKGLTPLCILMWVFRDVSWLNALPQVWQTKGLSPVCFLMWFCSWNMRLKYFPQKLHTIFRWSCSKWAFLWRSNSISLENFKWQKGHTWVLTSSWDLLGSTIMFFFLDTEWDFPFFSFRFITTEHFDGVLDFLLLGGTTQYSVSVLWIVRDRFSSFSISMSSK